MDLQGNHFTCRYWPIKKTVKATLNGQKWVSRCRHDFFIINVVDYTDRQGNPKNPTMLRTWFNPDGKQWAQTGDLERKD